MKNGFINLPNQNLAIPAFINLEKYRQQLETVFNIDISLSPKLEYRRDLLDTIKTGLAGQDPNLYRNIEFFLSENPNYSSANFTIINLGLNFSEVTIAHELGHILMQRGDVLSQYDDSFRSIFMEFSRVFINDLSQDPIYKGIPLWNMSVEDTRESFADYWAVFSLGEVNESKISIRSNTIEKFKNNLPETYKYFLWLEEQLPYIMQKTAVKQVSK